MALKPSEVQSFYKRFGKKQDLQSFYENPAIEELIGFAHFAEAEHVFEFGFGTGRLAARLLTGYLPATAACLGCDLIQTMVGLDRERLSKYGGLTRVLQSDGSIHFPLRDSLIHCVTSTYVLGLLSERDIREFLHKAYRVLDVGGRLCLVNLAKGTTFPLSVVSNMWAAIFRLWASLVGGCRPIHLEQYINAAYWKLEYRNISNCLRGTIRGVSCPG